MSQLITRRWLLKSALSAIGVSMVPSLHRADSVLEKRTPKGLQLSCSSLGFPDMTWDKALVAMKKLGFRYVDLAMFEGWTHLSPSKLTEPEKHGKKIQEVCNRLEVEPIAVHANFNPMQEKGFPGLTTNDAGARKLILEHFDRVLACTATAQIPSINLQPGKFVQDRSRQDCLDNAIGLLREMTPRARREGITLSFENHLGSIGEKPRDVLELLRAVEDLKLDYDFSHVVASGTKLEDTLPLLKDVVHVGVRNAKLGNHNLGLGKGEELAYPLGDFLQALREAKVDAFVSVEYYQASMRPSIVPLKKLLERELKLPEKN